MPVNLGDSAVARGLENISFDFNCKKKKRKRKEKKQSKECKNHHLNAHISHTLKVLLKIPQARLQENLNHELSDVEVQFRKVRGIQDQIVNTW